MELRNWVFSTRVMSRVAEFGSKKKRTSFDNSGLPSIGAPAVERIGAMAMR